MEILNINLLKTILILPIIDFIYLNLISSYFQQQIRDVQGSDSNFRIIPAILCYIALVIVLYMFVINTDASKEDKILKAFILGLCVYAVYEMTNYALLDKWRVKTVVIDTLWGGVLFALTTFLVTTINF
jgi:uncharacterized membrane protein